MNLDNYTFDQLIELKNEVNSRINSFEDGYFYICDVRSYGRNWKENHVNPHTVQELCYQYNGDEGIVDVYTNNPNLNIDNYGNVMYVPTKEDLEKWKNYRFIETHIPGWEKELVEWENRDNVPFSHRPLFAPIYSAETIEQYKEEMSELEGTFVKPVNIERHFEDEG
jgi:hypothetical protein